MDTMVYRGGCEQDLDPDDSGMEACVPPDFLGLLMVVCRLIVEAEVIFAQIRAVWKEGRLRLIRADYLWFCTSRNAARWLVVKMGAKLSIPTHTMCFLTS